MNRRVLHLTSLLLMSCMSVDKNAKIQSDGGAIADGPAPSADAPRSSTPTLDAGRGMVPDARVTSPPVQPRPDAAAAPSTSDASPVFPVGNHPPAMRSDAGLPPEEADAAQQEPDAEIQTPDAATTDPTGGRDCRRVNCDCTKNGKLLAGNVQFVTFPASADFKVRVLNVRNEADLRVQKTDLASPRNCGQWHEVSFSPDFTVEEVTIGEDFSVVYIDATDVPGHF